MNEKQEGYIHEIRWRTEILTVLVLLSILLGVVNLFI